MGKIINELKAKVQTEYDAAADKVKQAELAARNAAETVDITLPAKTRAVGGLHPLLWQMPPRSRTTTTTSPA